MSIRIRVILVSILSLLVPPLTFAFPGEASDQKQIAQRIGRPDTSDEEAVCLCRELRQLTPLADEIPVLAGAASSPRLSDRRKAIAAALLFERQIRAGMKVGDVAKILRKPNWLKSVRERSEETGGGFPVDWKNGETRFSIETSLSGGHFSPFIRVESDTVTEHELFSALQGDDSRIGDIKVTAVALPR